MEDILDRVGFCLQEKDTRQTKQLGQKGGKQKIEKERMNIGRLEK